MKPKWGGGGRRKEGWKEDKDEVNRSPRRENKDGKEISPKGAEAFRGEKTGQGPKKGRERDPKTAERGPKRRKKGPKWGNVLKEDGRRPKRGKKTRGSPSRGRYVIGGAIE